MALNAFQRAALHKIATADISHEEKVRSISMFYGGEEIPDCLPEGSPDLNFLLAEAKKLAA